MRARSREIQTFNLSMMDVISGAMGAFLIIMIILARYYRAEPENAVAAEQLQAELEQAQAQLDAARELIQPQTGGIFEDLRVPLSEALRNLDRARDQVRQLHRELDEADAELRRLRPEVGQLREENRQVNAALNMRRPLTFQADPLATVGVGVNLYVRDSKPGENGTSMPPFDPDRAQAPMFNGDLLLDAGASPVWLVRDVPRGTRFEVYVRLTGSNPPPMPVPVRITIRRSDQSNVSYQFQSEPLTRAQPWSLAGFLISDDDRNLSARAATSEERASARREVEQRKRQGG